MKLVRNSRLLLRATLLLSGAGNGALFFFARRPGLPGGPQRDLQACFFIEILIIIAAVFIYLDCESRCDDGDVECQERCAQIFAGLLILAFIATVICYFG